MNTLNTFEQAFENVSLFDASNSSLFVPQPLVHSLEGTKIKFRAAQNRFPNAAPRPKKSRVRRCEDVSSM